MDFFTADFFMALITIVFIDLILAGDNAIVIALAARNLHKDLQRKAVIYGTFGAIAIRAVATVIVVKLLNMPGLMLVGGFVLIWIAYKLLVEESKPKGVRAGGNLSAAIRTIIIADAAMGIDNVLAVAGAAQGQAVLVILGLLISIPIVVWGSTVIILWINRFPWIIYIGSGVLAFTAAKMITHERFIAHFLSGNSLLKWSFTLLVVAVVLLAGKMAKEKHKKYPTIN